ncbi:hypothetical protein GE09DRAFT_681689 [Coniochaeta sp. 2T2.1]|nr:hypothetical protein GE09DRAFT_681689 [Coniochaeta sp. 2T2.1]
MAGLSSVSQYLRRRYPIDWVFGTSCVSTQYRLRDGQAQSRLCSALFLSRPQVSICKHWHAKSRLRKSTCRRQPMNPSASERCISHQRQTPTPANRNEGVWETDNWQATNRCLSLGERGRTERAGKCCGVVRYRDQRFRLSPCLSPTSPLFRSLARRPLALFKATPPLCCRGRDSGTLPQIPCLFALETPPSTLLAHDLVAHCASQ